jgi:phosphopantothenoylcysteine decarboxylase / phosphopantothenate---cysteine ligase
VRFVVTAGPTREPIDPVRFLSNRSSGKMGYAIAEAALESGHDVTLISGPVNLSPPERARFIRVTTSEEMFESVQGAVGDCDVLVMCAAVADYKPAKFSPQKLKKENTTRTLELVPTPDILSAIARAPRLFLAVGFAAETDNVDGNARKKLRVKHCDMIIANDVSRVEFGMESDENEVEIFFQTGERKKIPRAPKKIIARELVKIISKTREKRLTKK